MYARTIASALRGAKSAFLLPVPLFKSALSKQVDKCGNIHSRITSQTLSNSFPT